MLRAIDYPYQYELDVVFRDLDAMGHVNNALATGQFVEVRNCPNGNRLVIEPAPVQEVKADAENAQVPAVRTINEVSFAVFDHL